MIEERSTKCFFRQFCSAKFKALVGDEWKGDYIMDSMWNDLLKKVDDSWTESDAEKAIADVLAERLGVEFDWEE